MRVILPEHISRALFCCGFYDEAVCFMLLDCLAEGQVFVDVGAHFGFFSLLAARIVGEKGAVVAFEPSPETFRVLRANVAGLANAYAVNRAVAAASGHARLQMFGRVYSGWNTLGSPRMDWLKSQHAIEVETVSLDEYCACNNCVPQVVKIDAEDSESAVLAGMQGLLRRARPTIIMECGSRVSLAAQRRLAAEGYSAYRYAGQGRIEAVPRDDVGDAVVSNLNLMFRPGDIARACL